MPLAIGYERGPAEFNEVIRDPYCPSRDDEDRLTIWRIIGQTFYRASPEVWNMLKA